MGNKVKHIKYNVICAVQSPYYYTKFEIYCFLFLPKTRALLGELSLAVDPNHCGSIALSLGCIHHRLAFSQTNIKTSITISFSNFFHSFISWGSSNKVCIIEPQRRRDRIICIGSFYGQLSFHFMQKYRFYPSAMVFACFTVVH